MSSASTAPGTSPPATEPPAAPPRHYSLWAGFLSFLIPGLGQISQGRIGKGTVFMVCLLGLFFTGQALGDWKNVYLPNVANQPPVEVGSPAVLRIVNPLLHLGQPVIKPVYHRWHYAGQFWIGVAAWPAIWQYNQLPVPAKETNPFLHDFQKEPDAAEINTLLINSDKTPDLAWVYTVIAGVMNILVIYDAYAGPALGASPPERKPAPPPPEGSPS